MIWCEGSATQQIKGIQVTDERPTFVAADASEWRPMLVRFNSNPILLYRIQGDPSQIRGWVNNPRIEMILKRWRNENHRAPNADPGDDTILDLMLKDDERNNDRFFDVENLGEDVKRNGVREPLIVTWDGALLDGNRRKFAVKWATSELGDPSTEHLQQLARVPMYVLHKDATQSEKDSILIQENYAPSMKIEWPPIVTNGHIFQRFEKLCELFPHETELRIRQRLTSEFPRFNSTGIRNRIETWHLIQEFRVEFGDEFNETDMDVVVNDRFQYFLQAHDTFRNQLEYNDPTFKDILFKGIRHQLFPNFAGVRMLDQIVANSKATGMFLSGEGMAKGEVAANFKKVQDEVGRERAIDALEVAMRIQQAIDILDRVTSVELAELSDDLIDRLENALDRITSQARASAT